MHRCTSWLAAMVAAAGLWVGGAVFAQNPAVNPAEAKDAAAEAQRQVTQPYNNAPVW